jgi:hypothetical protein
VGGRVALTSMHSSRFDMAYRERIDDTSALELIKSEQTCGADLFDYDVNDPLVDHKGQDPMKLQ